MLKFYVIFFFIFLITNSNANNKDKIIKNLQNTNNLIFQFEQNINGKIENGNCTIKYPKRIYCKYSDQRNKILVSNGKSLVIKSTSSYYRYPLRKTPLNLILDKKFLVNKIYDLKERIIDDTYINYTIDVFFDNQTFNLIGWQTKDIYQNLNITLFSSIKVNQNIKKNLFRLPSQN